MSTPSVFLLNMLSDTRKKADFPKMAEQGPMAIAMRLRNQLQSVYKLDPLRNEASVDIRGNSSIRRGQWGLFDRSRAG